ncbi:rhodanese-like domain-containing protein [Clostridium algoriphilum]|uniref:rhodanese-like domain-containing protein n=1 Tax=Clostridium algoriphilum TaxID=198347 RepID=UPI001CF0DA8B|nr:rhodanese-like domain-containing protein [Clostridium algoriphilum]MCB2294234.1 rhodanese-like domain-containing protein [Clostridium algoriphilum]
MFSIFKKYNTISVHDLDGKLGKINLIDVREGYEYEGGHVPTAKNISLGTILANPRKYINKSNEYHIICQSGSRSERACKELSDEGYKVVNISGGTGSYILPLER